MRGRQWGQGSHQGRSFWINSSQWWYTESCFLTPRLPEPKNHGPDGVCASWNSAEHSGATFDATLPPLCSHPEPRMDVPPAHQAQPARPPAESEPGKSKKFVFLAVLNFMLTFAGNEMSHCPFVALFTRYFAYMLRFSGCLLNVIIFTEVKLRMRGLLVSGF